MEFICHSEHNNGSLSYKNEAELHISVQHKYSKLYLPIFMIDPHDSFT